MKSWILLIVLFAHCKSSKIASSTLSNIAAPPTIVYKTKGDYAALVPVTLSEDKSEIVSYPAPADMMVHGVLATPIALRDGYLQDIKGIGPNVAFIKMTYEEYSKLTTAPTIKELYAMIVDKDPITEMCSCGVQNDSENTTKLMNRLIKDKKLNVACNELVKVK
jgi:hypothetical protein